MLNPVHIGRIRLLFVILPNDIRYYTGAQWQDQPPGVLFSGTGTTARWQEAFKTPRRRVVAWRRKSSATGSGMWAWLVCVCVCDGFMCSRSFVLLFCEFPPCGDTHLSVSAELQLAGRTRTDRPWCRRRLGAPTCLTYTQPPNNFAENKTRQRAFRIM